MWMSVGCWDNKEPKVRLNKSEIRFLQNKKPQSCTTCCTKSDMTAMWCGVWLAIITKSGNSSIRWLTLFGLLLLLLLLLVLKFVLFHLCLSQHGKVTNETVVVRLLQLIVTTFFWAVLGWWKLFKASRANTFNLCMITPVSGYLVCIRANIITL